MLVTNLPVADPPLLPPAILHCFSSKLHGFLTGPKQESQLPDLRINKMGKSHYFNNLIAHIPHAKFIHIGLSNENGTSFMKFFHDCCIVVWNERLEHTKNETLDKKDNS